MSQIKSAALQFFAAALGITRLDSDSQQLEDGIITPVFDIGNVAALGLGSGTKGGYFYGQLRATRVGSSGSTSSTIVDPYRIVGANGYPSPGIPAASIPPDLDVWLIAVNAFATAATDFVNFHLSQTMAEVNRGWSTTELGPKTVVIGFWDTVISNGGMLSNRNGISRHPLNFLFPRADLLQSVITTGGVGTSTMQAILEMWVGPKGHKPPTAF